MQSATCAGTPHGTREICPPATVCYCTENERTPLREAELFDKIAEQRRLVADAAEKTKRARRSQERRRLNQTARLEPSSPAAAPVDYSVDPAPYGSETLTADP